jgi:hypothetical protein
MERETHDGGVVTAPQKVVRPESVEELQAILQDGERFPQPGSRDGEFSLLDSLRLLFPKVDFQIFIS